MERDLKSLERFEHTSLLIVVSIVGAITCWAFASNLSLVQMWIPFFVSFSIVLVYIVMVCFVESSDSLWFMKPEEKFMYILNIEGKNLAIYSDEQILKEDIESMKTSGRFAELDFSTLKIDRIIIIEKPKVYPKGGENGRS